MTKNITVLIPFDNWSSQFLPALFRDEEEALLSKIEELFPEFFEQNCSKLCSYSAEFWQEVGKDYFNSVIDYIECEGAFRFNENGVKFIKHIFNKSTFGGGWETDYIQAEFSEEDYLKLIKFANECGLKEYGEYFFTPRSGFVPFESCKNEFFNVKPENWSDNITLLIFEAIEKVMYESFLIRYIYSSYNQGTEYLFREYSRKFNSEEMEIINKANEEYIKELNAA